jgi:hypothetical protein
LKLNRTGFYQLLLALLFSSATMFLLKNRATAVWFVLFPGLIIGLLVVDTVCNDARNRPHIPEPNLVVKETIHGNMINVTTTGQECWDMPLPAANRFINVLKIEYDKRKEYHMFWRTDETDK